MSKKNLPKIKRGGISVRYTVKGPRLEMDIKRKEHESLKKLALSYALIGKNNNLDRNQIDLLVFFRDEAYFTRREATKYIRDIDGGRRVKFNDLVKMGYISKIVDINNSNKTFYRVEMKGSAVVRCLYNIFTGSMSPPTTENGRAKRNHTKDISEWFKRIV